MRAWFRRVLLADGARTRTTTGRWADTLLAFDDLADARRRCRGWPWNRAEWHLSCGAQVQGWLVRYSHGMDRIELVRRHPILFHMAEDGTWPAIQAHGLLSTKALVDLYNPRDAVRASILQGVRRDSILLERPGIGRAIVRDQGPLKFLDECLVPGTTRQEFLDLLNGRVFFWLTRERLPAVADCGTLPDSPPTGPSARHC